MNIDTENKMYEMCLYTNILPKIVDTSQIKINTKNNKKDTNSVNNDMHNRIKRKASVINYQQRNLQERMSSIQAKEVQIQDLEETLQQAKSAYSQDLENSKKQSSKKQIKIRTLSRQITDLEEKKKDKEKRFEHNEKYITEKDKIIFLINDTLRQLSKIKNDLSIHKTKLMALENELKKGELKVENSKSYLNEEFIVNPLDFLFVQDDVETGIIINIYV